MDMSKYMGESMACDKKLMLERKEPLKRSGDSLPSSHKRANFAFETLRVEYFARAKLKFVEEGGGLLTNAGAGALLADKSPIRHSRVFCTRWNGLTKSNGMMEALDDDEFSGGPLNLLDAAKGFVKVNAKTKWRQMEDGSGRVEYPEYPSAAVEEVIVNGLMHRDYLEIGSEVHIDMFDDRLEVYSPGGMVSGELIQSLDTRAVAGVVVSNASVNIFFGMNFRPKGHAITGETNETGAFTEVGKTYGDEIEISIGKSGYYPSKRKLCYATMGRERPVSDGKWQPYCDMQQMVLRKIRNPISTERFWEFRPYMAKSAANYAQNAKFSEQVRDDGEIDESHFNKANCWVLRSRCKVDENGNLISANYSVIHDIVFSCKKGGMGGFSVTGAFNPTPNDTNLESK